MAEFTRDIKQLQQTAAKQPSFAPPSQSPGGDIVNLIGTGLDFYSKNQAQGKLDAISQASKETEYAIDQYSLAYRDFRLEMEANNLTSGASYLMKDKNFLAKIPKELQTQVIQRANKTTGTTSSKVMTEADLRIKKQQDTRLQLETNVNNISPYLSSDISLDATDEELQNALFLGQSNFANQEAKKAKITLDNLELTKQGKEANVDRDLFLMNYDTLGLNQYRKTAASFIQQANFDDPTSVQDLINRNGELRTSYIAQAVKAANDAGVSLTPTQATEALANNTTIFDNVSSFLGRSDIKAIGANQVETRINNMILAMLESENKNQRNLGITIALGSKIKNDALGRKFNEAYGGALMENVGDDIFEIFLNNKPKPTAEDERTVKEAKVRGEQFFKDVFKNAEEGLPDETKKAVGDTLKSKLQAGKKTRERMISEGGLATYIQAMSGGTPSMLLLPEDQAEILLGVTDYAGEFLRRAIPQVLKEQVPRDSNLYTKPLFPKGNETSLKVIESVNKLNALDPDTLKVTWNQDAPISDSVKRYNKFVGEFLTAIDKLGATEEEVVFLKTEISRGFVVANQ